MRRRNAPRVAPLTQIQSMLQVFVALVVKPARSLSVPLPLSLSLQSSSWKRRWEGDWNLCTGRACHWAVSGSSRARFPVARLTMPMRCHYSIPASHAPSPSPSVITVTHTTTGHPRCGVQRRGVQQDITASSTIYDTTSASAGAFQLQRSSSKLRQCQRAAKGLRRASRCQVKVYMQTSKVILWNEQTKMMLH
ncbi:hypothetical protein CC80DRAFT_187511 [Byssothecium circinans]|uniref:Uncharacterized protein n=1 Tax=Byssothecium circinans TaxID=147558 RepID=A0A6A5TJL1_9PLEO|nr:hypothetical protein CC80DRAFT_187511 [Byssothecium circinans]